MEENKNSDQQTIIAVDAMGGDYAPDEIVKGVAAATLDSSVQVAIIGVESQIRNILQKTDHHAGQIRICHTDEWITNEDNPREVIRKKANASMILGAQMVGAGDAHGMVSAGNTGAYVLAASMYIPRIEGVRKVAIATVYPTRNVRHRRDIFALLLDVGANIHCSVENLVQFAIMGQVYASDIKGVTDPTVALLNIGKEPYKGGKMLSTVHKVLDELPNVNFVGNIEATDVLTGLADVVVTEGYVGNIVMKTVEGLAETASQLGKYAFKHSLLGKLGLIALSGKIRELKKLTDYSEYGGAPLLGFKEIVIKAHGRSKAKAISNAIKLAAKSHRDRICLRMEMELAHFSQSIENVDLFDTSE